MPKPTQEADVPKPNGGAIMWYLLSFLGGELAMLGIAYLLKK